MINITVDLGNYNIKYLGEKKGEFSSRYSTKFNPNDEMYDRIEMDGKTTYVGVGELEREFNKVDKNYLPLLLYAINEATTESDINLCLLLPVVQMPNKNKLIDALKGKLFSCCINGRQRAIKINKVAVLPEGYVGYYSLKEDDDTLVIDIGSRTINYSCFIDGKPHDSFTEKLGIFDLYSTIKEVENSKGSDYVEEDIERLIKKNKINVDSRIYMDFFMDILNRTKGRINMKTYKVYFIGGGAMLLKQVIETNTPAIVHEDAKYANVIGAYRLSQNVWKDIK